MIRNTLVLFPNTRFHSETISFGINRGAKVTFHEQVLSILSVSTRARVGEERVAFGEERVGFLAGVIHGGRSPRSRAWSRGQGRGVPVSEAILRDVGTGAGVGETPQNLG